MTFEFLNFLLVFHVVVFILFQADVAVWKQVLAVHVQTYWALNVFLLSPCSLCIHQCSLHVRPPSGAVWNPNVLIVATGFVYVWLHHCTATVVQAHEMAACVPVLICPEGSLPHCLQTWDIFELLSLKTVRKKSECFCISLLFVPKTFCNEDCILIQSVNNTLSSLLQKLWMHLKLLCGSCQICKLGFVATGNI